ncbi:ankyrin repeat-containing domain protein [Fennellomyces sp. T-0311]|nr:ankyrin repeat-containing domain protein [Fennellomyces sp. T-0311]
MAVSTPCDVEISVRKRSFSLVSTATNNDTGRSNNVVRLIAKDENPSSQLNDSSTTSINIYDEPFDLSLELPILDDPATLIWKAAQSGDLSAVEYAIQTVRGSRTQLVNMRDPETECTLLYIVASNVKEPVPLMQLLLDYGADPTAQNVYNVQAIHAVALHCPNPMPAIELLLKHEVDPNARDGDGWTPMHYVARFCKDPQEILKLLESHGANVNATDVTQKSPLFPLLANGDHKSVLDWFIHTVKADVGFRGEFLDQLTRRTSPGTILLQTAKYARRHCMEVLTQSKVAMEALRVAVTQDELNQATLLVRQQLDKEKQKSNETEDSKVNADLDAMLTMLEGLRRTLEEDQSSTVAAEIHMQRTGQQLVPRRQSLLGSLRRKSRQPPLTVTKQKATSSPQVLQDLASMSRASFGSLSSQGTDKENEAVTVQRQTSLLKRVGNILMRQKDGVASEQSVA